MSKKHTTCHGGARSLPWTLWDHWRHCWKAFVFLAALAACGGTTPVWANGPSEAELGVALNEIHCNPDDETQLVEFIELYNRGSEAVDLSGWYFDAGLTYEFPAGTVLAAGDYAIVAESPDHMRARWSSGRLGLDMRSVLGPYEGRLDNDGERIALCNASGDLIDEVEYELGFPWPTVGDPTGTGSSGSSHSMQLVNPSFDNSLAISWRSAAPTPLSINKNVYSSNLRPFVREVESEPAQPKSGDTVTVTALVTDSDGIASVILEYQVVLPGHYIPLRLPVALATLQSNPDTDPTDNPDYFSLANWTQVSMRDDGGAGDAVAGDSIYTAVIPGQAHRTLVRYRLKAIDSLNESTWAPYSDDASMNFACYVYDGVPDYEGFSSEMLETLPVYHLLTRQEDLEQAMGFNSSDQIDQFSGGSANPVRYIYNWWGTFICDGVVYDNICYRLRGANGRYLGGRTKRSMRFRFNRGHYLQAKDAAGEPYPTQWRTLTTAKGFDNRLTLTYSLNEHINFYLFNKMGVPAPYSYFFHFRVVDAQEEAPDPWRGDFWGLGFAQEAYDVRFLEAHNLEKGNLYKLINATTDAKEQQSYQAPHAVTDGSDHDAIQYRLNGYSTPDFIRAHVRLDKWYAYHSLAQAIRHYDYWPSANKNAAWYFEPVYTEQNEYLGKMWTLPWDTDATWGPTWNNGYDVVYNSIFRASDNGENPELQPDYYSAIREVRDLLWQTDQIESLLAEVAKPLAHFVEADLVRWLNAPSDAGNYNGLGGAGKKGLPALVEDMLAFAFEGGSWPGGSVGDGGRAAFLDQLADNADGHLVPDRPWIAYIGEPNYPINKLRFWTSPFSDPQGDGTFGAMKWRVAEVSPHTRETSSSNAQDDPLIDKGSVWRHFKGTSEPSAQAGAWRQAGFDDSAWARGKAPIGYGEDFLGTTLSDMRGGYTTIYLRRTFTLSDPSVYDALSLDVLYDDGVNIWINGIPVFQDNVASVELACDATALSATEYTDYTSTTLSHASDYLVEGTNVVAIQLLNASISGSSDCYIDLRLGPPSTNSGTTLDSLVAGEGAYEIETLWEGDVSNEFVDEVQIPASVLKAGRTYRVRCRVQDNAGYWSHWSDPVQFTAGRALSEGLIAGLRITEVMYHPAPMWNDGGFDDDEFEFIELKNVGDELLDLSGVSLVDAVTFGFQDGDIVTLEPGAFVLVVRNREAFTFRYGDEVAARIAGQYEGKLANEGEYVRLVDFQSGTIAAFEYRDDSGWPELADGEGYSLVPLEAALPGEPSGSLDDGANWRASIRIGGSPGCDDL